MPAGRSPQPLRAAKAEPETDERAYERRVNESRTVEMRVTSVYSEADLKAELQKVWL